MKRKWSSSEQKKRASELEASWQAVLSKHTTKKPTKQTKTVAASKVEPFRRETPRLPSHGMQGVATKAVQQLSYTGTAMKGIGTLHKSNAVPIFTDQEAKDQAAMRR